MIYRNAAIYLRRKYSSSTRRTLASHEIRKIFLDYFIKDHRHKFVRSSPVVPLCDPTVAFVNAGMNQFKSVFLGKLKPTFTRVVNSQKCVRVGGKHNDLSVVGKDGYHHTFFEMLGNWSFGDYFKRDACLMAWNLLRDLYGIDPSRLYVTYFGGDEALNLPPDIECREIWRSLGLSDERILAYGCKENFWEMGTTGPCGPCTEIHIDHLPSSDPRVRSKLVNAGYPELTELWNLVFIEYNRNIDGSIKALPEKHIDTGMGMERLTAILQGKSSNYDTDLFMPIFNAIQKISNLCPYSREFTPSSEKYVLDTSYRIIADHSRMILACLADGMLPDQNHKLRRIIRKSLLLSSNIFRSKTLLQQIIPQVSEILGPTYPEMFTKLPNVLQIISHEQEILIALRESYSSDVKRIILNNSNLEELDLFDSPGFVPAYKDLQNEKVNFQNKIMPGKFAFKLRDTYGLDEEAIEKLVEAEHMHLDREGYENELIKAKERSKDIFASAISVDETSQEVSNLTANIKDTDNFYKYNYAYDTNSKLYEVPPVKTKILAIIQNGTPVKTISANSQGALSIITEKSNFYFESGGQEGDRGSIMKMMSGSNVQFDVKGVILSNGCVLHSGKFSDCCIDSDLVLSETDEVELRVDAMPRTKNIAHHTATHLLNAGIRHLIKSVIYQSSSNVTSDYLKLELGILGEKVTKEVLVNVESLIRAAINNNALVTIKIVSIQDVLNRNDIVMVPGEIYPETGLRLLQIEDDITGLTSKELCCGTHALSTAELQDFCLTNFKTTGRSKYAFFGVAGTRAVEIREKGKEFIATITQCENLMKNEEHKVDAVEVRLLKLRNEILHSDMDLPYLVKLECLERINALVKNLKDASRTILKEFVEMEMRTILQERSVAKAPYIVHFLKCSTMMEDISLQKATRLCTDRPILVASFTDGKIKARCCVPKNQTNQLAADEWLEKFANIFRGQISPPKGQNPKEICNMKAKKIHSAVFHEYIEAAISEAKKFASSHL